MVLVDVVVVRVGHVVDAGGTLFQSLHERSAPTTRIHPCRIVIADSPSHATLTRLDSSQMAAHLSPENIAQRHNNLWRSINNFEQFHASADIQTVDGVRRTTMFECVKMFAVHRYIESVGFGSVNKFVQFGNVDW